MSQTLASLLAQLRDALDQTRLTFPLPGSEQQREWALAAVHQLDDYVLPRLEAIEAPLLAVVSGSTGAGKSTLVNSLVRQMVTLPGVIRPTTKAPVLVCHPDDQAWFASSKLLRGLARSDGEGPVPRSLHVVATEQLPHGLALIDAPDIDSVDSDNRHLAGQLMAAADLWLFITSATRYADAVPWAYLLGASRRDASVAVVIDRVPPAAMVSVPEHLAAMMTSEGLGDAPLFAVPEVKTDDQGLLPIISIQPIRDWLNYLASNQITRAHVVMRTLTGALVDLENGATQLAQSVVTQKAALARLRHDAQLTFARTRASIEAHAQDGTLLRGEVMQRWQEFVGAGEFMRSIETRIGRLRDRITAALTGHPDQVKDIEVAVKSSLESLVIDAIESALDRVQAAWLADPAGRFLIDWSEVDITAPPADLAGIVERAIRDWQSDVIALIQQEGAGKRSRARLAALGVNVAGVALMLVAFAHTAGLAGAEVGIAGGTAIVAQKVLELIFGDQTIRHLTNVAGDQLNQRLGDIVDDQRQRLFSQTIDRFPPETIDADGLERHIKRMRKVRQQELASLERGIIARVEHSLPVGDDLNETVDSPQPRRAEAV